MKLDILAIGVHPDDVELSCCGTLLKQIEKGNKIGLLDLTRGELGTRGSAKLRTQEALEAAQMMGALVRVQLSLKDGFFSHQEDNLLKIITIIRQYQPDIIICNAIEDRHPDHARAAKLTSDACFLAGLRRIETTTEGVSESADFWHRIGNDFQKQGFSAKLQAAWRPKQVYHYIQDRPLKPDFVVDITPYFEQKMKIIFAYQSQFYNPKSDEPATPISSPEFLEALTGRDTANGRLINVPKGEGFTVERAIGVNDLFDIY